MTYLNPDIKKYLGCMVYKGMILYPTMGLPETNNLKFLRCPHCGEEYLDFQGSDTEMELFFVRHVNTCSGERTF
jgi:hypothetical protein